MLLAVLFAAASWLTVIFLDRPTLLLFGADQALLPLAQAYLQPIKFAVTLFVFNQMLSSFLRNDNHPELATAAVMCGGVFNIVGDYLFVFTFDMGIYGVGHGHGAGRIDQFFCDHQPFFLQEKHVAWCGLKHRLPKARRLR